MKLNTQRVWEGLSCTGISCSKGHMSFTCVLGFTDSPLHAPPCLNIVVVPFIMRYTIIDNTNMVGMPESNMIDAFDDTVQLSALCTLCTRTPQSYLHKCISSLPTSLPYNLFAPVLTLILLCTYTLLPTIHQDLWLPSCLSGFNG